MIKRIFLCLFVVLSSVVILLTFDGCQPHERVTIKNNQNQEVSLWVRPVSAMHQTPDLQEQGVILANSTKSFDLVFTTDSWANLIEIKGQNGTTLFSHNYTMDDLDKIGWNIIIPAATP